MINTSKQPVFHTEKHFRQDNNQLTLFTFKSKSNTEKIKGNDVSESYWKKIKAKRFVKLFPSLSLISLITMLLMTIYEITKQMLHPQISIWESHMITIFFASIIAPLGGYYALRKIEKLREKAVTELEEKKIVQNKLEDFNNHLEELVEKRAAELSETNHYLKKEIRTRKNAEEALRVSERRYRYLFMESPVGIFYYDRNLNIIEVSEKLLQIFQLKKEEAVNFNEYNSQDLSLIPAMESAIAGREGYYEGLYKTTSSNSKKYISFRTTPFSLDGENITGGMAIVEDITERKESEKELIKAKEKAEQSNRLKSEFLSMVSHEIRTPLNVMLSFSSLIKDELDNKVKEELKDSFEIMKNAGQRIIRTVDSMIDMSELNSGNYEFNAEKINLSEFLENMVFAEFLQCAKEKGLKLNLDLVKEEIYIRADNYSLRQIFRHLIDNAVKFTLNGEIKIVARRIGNSEIYVEIIDTGLGISPDFMPHLFEPFRQEEQGYTRKYEGNGLGLALVKKYCELNNGTIDVKSEKNRGTKFRVTFPLLA